MLRYKVYIFVLPILFILQQNAFGQDVEENIPKQKTELLSVGFSFDYLKLHTLLLDDREKWEGAINFSIKNKVNIITELGTATLMPEDAYKNAIYTVEGSYGRFGLDYIFQVNPDNHFLLGFRYSMSTYNESITYTVTNPIFEDQYSDIERNGLSANWLEFVITSEKRINRIFNNQVRDFLYLGFKVRIKSNLNYSQFDFANTKQLPGYGLTNAKVNPELNLYLKLRLGILSSKNKN